MYVRAVRTLAVVLTLTAGVAVPPAWASGRVQAACVASLGQSGDEMTRRQNRAICGCLRYLSSVPITPAEETALVANFRTEALVPIFARNPAVKRQCDQCIAQAVRDNP